MRNKTEAAGGGVATVDKLSNQLKNISVGVDQHAASLSDILRTDPTTDHSAIERLLQLRPTSDVTPARKVLHVHIAERSRRDGNSRHALYHLSQCHAELLRRAIVAKGVITLTEQCLKRGEVVQHWPKASEHRFLAERSRLLTEWSCPPAGSGWSQLVDRLISAVPAGWTVIQLTEVPALKQHATGTQRPGAMLLSRFIGGRSDSVLVSQVPEPPTGGCVSFWCELQSILADNRSRTRRITTLHSERSRLDQRLATLIGSMERAWLGWRSYLLTGCRSPSSEAVELPQRLLKQFSSSQQQRERLRLLLECFPMQVGYVRAAVAAILGVSVRSDVCKQLADELVAEASSQHHHQHQEKQEVRLPVVLVLDTDVQHYPWECVWPLTRSPVTRVPSLAVLLALLTVPRPPEPAPDGNRHHHSLYVLNPDGDLVRTERRLLPLLEQTGWLGVVGRSPEAQQLCATLTSGKALAYCGHGSGSNYLSSDKVRGLHCRAATLLFGCGSGQLSSSVPDGGEVNGTPYAYLSAHCSRLLGFMWPLSDVQLDEFTETVFGEWRVERDDDDGSVAGGGVSCLATAVWAARRRTDSTLLAAAAVVYGLPDLPAFPS